MHPQFTRCRLVLSAVLIGVAVHQGDASALPVLDVEVLPGPAIGGPAIIPSQQVGQTFTATRSGQLTRIDLVLGQNGAGADFAVSIYPVSAGHPDLTQAALFSQTYPRTMLPLNPFPGLTSAFTSFDVSSAGILVEPGHQLGILVSRAFGATNVTSEWILWGMRQSGGVDAPVPYLGGELQVYYPGTSTWVDANGDDGGFRTYVEAVPEPGTALLVMTGALGLAASRRRLAS